MKKLLNTLFLTFSLIIATQTTVAMVDGSIKGNPSQISASGYPIGKPSMSDRTRRLPSKYGNTKGKSIMDLYQGSSHQRMLRAQKKAYAPSARENERVFGAPYRKQSDSKSKLEKMIESGLFRLIIEPDGSRYLVKNK